MPRKEIIELIQRLRHRQAEVSKEIIASIKHEDLDRRVPPDRRTIRELAEHVLGILEGYFVGQVQSAIGKKN